MAADAQHRATHNRAARGDARRRPSSAESADKLSQLLAGDLDIIVAKALKKNPAERYPTVSAFADDLCRYLNDQPISARADAMTYRVVKFARRNRTAVALTSLFVVALIGGLIGTLTQAQRATEQAAIAATQRDLAMDQLTRAEALNDLNQVLLTDAAPSGTSFTVSDLLAQAERIVERQHAQDVDTRVELMVALGRQYRTQDEREHARRVLEAAYGLSASVADPSTKAKARARLPARYRTRASWIAQKSSCTTDLRWSSTSRNTPWPVFSVISAAAKLRATLNERMWLSSVPRPPRGC